jgi:chromosome partitioning protein
MIISFVNQKGGVGKTTTAINLAIALKKKNHTLVFVDADPQGSAVQWHTIEDNRSFEILHHPSPIDATDIGQLAMNYDYVVIDAPPAIGDISKAILAVTDLAIIPLSPSALDVWSCWGTLKMIDEIRPMNSNLEVKLLINRKIPGTKIGREAREIMKKFQMDVFDTELCQRVAFIDAMTSGVSVMQYAPHSKAAGEIERLCEEIIPQQSMEASQPDVNNQYLNFPHKQAENIGWDRYQ